MYSSKLISRYPEYPSDKILQSLAQKKSVATVIHEILSADLEAAHHSVQELLGVCVLLIFYIAFLLYDIKIEEQQ
jgi:hypothetical protein